MHPRRYPSIATAITAIIAQACGLVASNHESPPDGSQLAGSAGQSSGGTSPGGGTAASGGGAAGSATAGTLSIIGGAGALPEESCPTRTSAVFADQVVSVIGEQRVFYSWTTDEQVAELRAGTELFSRSERPGMGRGLLFTDLLAYSQSGPGPAATLAGTLLNDTFAKVRFAWTNPWATLLGFPGETYGNQLLEIELVNDAWIARFDRNGLTVVDVNNKYVPIEDALATPERIGAIYYQSSADDGSRYCGTFAQGSVAFREFALGNIAMVKRWSLATPEIAERMQSDIAELQAFEQQLPCFKDNGDWSSGVSCAWDGDSFFGNALGNYEFSLSLPSELYRPNASNIEALIAAVEASLPTGEPLVVRSPK